MSGIGWAVEQLLAGRKVRRAAWLPDEHVYPDNVGGNWLKWLAGWNCPVAFLARREDLEAGDWELNA